MSWILSKIWINVGTTGHFSSPWLVLLSTCFSFSYLILSTSRSHCGWRRKNSIEPKPVLMMPSPWRFTSSNLSITMPPLFILVSSKDSLLGRPIDTLGKMISKDRYHYLKHQNFYRFLNWRQEECAPGGCFVELSVQLAIIFMGKQFVLSIMEYYMPLIWRAINWLKFMGWSLKVIIINLVLKLLLLFRMGAEMVKNTLLSMWRISSCPSGLTKLSFMNIWRWWSRFEYIITAIII